jgi:hypothetical protein
MKIIDLTKVKSPVESNEQIPLTEIVKQMATTGDYSAKTITNYNRAARLFREFIGRDVIAAHVTSAMLEGFRAEIARWRSPKTAQCRADAIASIVKFADPKLLPERYRGNTRELLHIRIDICDSDRHKHPGRLEKILESLLAAVKEVSA